MITTAVEPKESPKAIKILRSNIVLYNKMFCVVISDN